MAQFRATISGNRGAASRLGSKASGMRIRANGWNVGAIVVLTHEHGKDVVRVYRTGGSHDIHPHVLIAEYREGDSK